MAPAAGQFATARGALARLRRGLPAGAARVLATLRRAGAAYLVGGAVRDAFLARAIVDWDIATDLEPDRVAALFPRVVLSGAKHGTVMVLTRSGPVEVTTFRGEGPYLDGRRPSHVHFHSDLHVDLARRDFTINAMAVDLAEPRLVDPFGGERDLRAGRIRCVGDANARFAEDGLRPLRALRFAATLGFNLDPATKAALSGALKTFESVARERQRDELEKLLGRGRRLRPALGLLKSSGMLHHLAAELERAPSSVPARLERLPADAYLRLAAWAVGARLDAEQALAIVARWRGSNRDQARVAGCVDAADKLESLPRVPTARELRIWVCGVGKDNAANAAQVLAALWPRRFADAPARLGRVLRPRPPLRVADLVVDGTDMLALGFRGPQVRAVLCRLLEMVLDRPGKNQKTVLLAAAHRLSTGPKQDMDPDR